MVNTKTFGLLLQLVVLVQGQTTTQAEDATSGITTGNITSSGSTTTSSSTSSQSRNSTAVTTPSPTATAQWPSLSNVGDCVFTCNNLAISQSNCTSIVDVGCYCPNQIYQTFVVKCVSLRCADQLKQTIQLAKDFCAVSSISISFTMTSFSTSVPSPTLTTTPTTTVSASTSGSRISNGLPLPGIYIVLSTLLVAAILPVMIPLG